MDDRHELRADLIAALMSHEQMTYADAERVVESFGKICPRCGAIMDADSCVTIWGQIE